MDNFNLDELMDLAEAYVGPMVDAIYRRLIERDFALEDPEVVMLLTALINILGHDNRGDRPTEVLLMAAYGERGVLDRPNMRVMRWRNGALSGSDLANEPGLGSSRTYQPGEMPMPSKPKPGLTRMHQEMNSEATSSGSPLRVAVPPKGAKVTQKVQTNQTIQDLDEMNDQLRSTKKELNDMTKTMLAMEEDRDMWRKLFEDCNKKQGQEIERLRQEYKERSEQVALTTSIEKVIPARDIPRGQSPMELLTPREMSQTTETRLPAETNRVTIPDPSDTLGDPVVEQTVRKLIETAGRLVANKNAPGSGVTAPYGTIDDTGRVQLSQTIIRQGISDVTPLRGNSRIPERKVRKMPAKKVSRVIDVQKNNQLKYNFTGVPETDPRACFNRATWSPAVNLQQPPLGTSHLILGDSLVRMLSNLRTSWVTTVMAFGGATIAQLYRMVELMNPGKIPNVMILVGTNDISRGSDEQEALWESMMVCLFTTLWQKFSCAVLTVCTVPMNARSLTASGRRHNEGVMRWNNILRNLANRNAGRMILMDIEHELRAMDQARLTTDGIHFDSVEGQAWLNRVFQERLDELEAELFDTGVLKEEGTVSDTVITTFVPPNLETRLGTVPAVTNYRQQSSGEPGRRTDVQDRLGEAPMRRTIHPRKRIGPVNQPIEEVTGTSRSDTRSETTSTSREERPSRGSLMWSRSIPSPWHIYKDELMKLDLQRVSFIEDARRMLNGATLSVSRLYSMTGVDWLIAASINFSSTTALRFADLEGLPSNNTIGPVNADTLETTEPADEGISTLEPPSAFEEMKRNLPESSSPGNTRNNDQRILMESPRRRRIEASARVPFLGTLPEEEWEVHHRDHESRTGCKLDRVAFMEEVWTVIQSYGTQSILQTGLNQPLMREVLDKLDECEGRLSELLIDSATDESEANSPIKITPQDNEGEVVYLSRTRRGTMRSKMVIDKINAMKMKLGSRVMPRRIGKTKVDSEISMKAGNSAKRKRVEEVMDLGQGDYQLSGTDRILTDIAMVPPILMAGLKSTGYKSKRSDRTLTGATLEMEILSQCGESKMRDFKSSPMNHGKGSVAGQLTPVEYNRLTVSETVSIDEPTGGYMEMLEYRNSARGYVVALEDEKAMEGYLEMMLQGTTLKQKAYGTLASSDVEAETIEQLVSLPWKAVVLRYFEEEMRTTPRIHALVAVPYVRTELQLRFAWCMMGLTREEYDSEERKRSKEEKVFLMTNLRDLIVQEGAAVACAKRRDALCFIRFLIEQISVPALSTCVKMLKEGDERTKAMFLLAMLDMQQSKPMRVNMKEPEELEPMKKIDEIRRFSNKELRLTKESMGALPKSSEYCGPIKKKSYSYVSGIIGMAYNPFLSEDIRDCFFDYEQAVLLRFWTSRIVTTKSVNNPQAKLGLVLEEEVTAPSVPKSDKRVEFGLGFSDELLRTSLMAVWELMKPSWCPSPNADSILRATQDIQRELNVDCNLRDLNIIYNVMITASKSNGEDRVELPGWGPEDWVKPGSCLAEVCGLEGHVCGSLDCVKTLEKQHKQLTVLFGNVVMKARTETELIADCHGGTDVNLVTALGFYSMFGSLESLLNLEQKHEMVTAISVEVFPGVLQTEQKYIGKWREAIETEMNIRHSETYCRPSGARYLVGSTLAPMCKSRYPVHFVAVDVKSTRTIVDQAFSVPKCVRLARMSEKSYELLCKMFSAVPERTKEELESILGKKFMGYVSGNFSDFEKQKQRGSTVTDYNAVDENDEIHRVMMEVEPLLEASGKRNWRSIMLTHDEFPCHCLLQTWWYPKRNNLVLIWDSGELLSMGLPDSSQPITIVIVGVMMAIRWLEAHVRENNRQEAPTREQLQKLDCLKDLDLFETMCKVLNIPMEVKKIWARKRLMPWFRANMTAWLYEYAKKHMSKHGRVYSEYQLDIGAGAFKRAFVTHRNAVTTAVKRISRTSERSGSERAEMLKEDLERNVALCLHNSFCRNRESNVDPLPCCKQRVEEQKCWRTASNSVRIVNDVLQDTETESAESASQEEEMEH